MKRICLFVILLVFNLICCAAEPPAVNQVFIPSVEVIDSNTLAFKLNISANFYIYRQRVTFNFADNLVAQLGSINLPAGITRLQKTGQSEEVYPRSVNMILPILGLKAGTAHLIAHYQGCSDSGFCYPPQEKTIQIEINQKLELVKAAFVTPIKPIQTTALSKISINDSVSNILNQESLFIVLLSFYGFGLLLAFTPCILPMIPILSGMIIGHGEHLGSKKAFLLSLTYVLSMSITYAIAGIFVALLGANLQIVFQNAWAVSLFGIIFILLSLSMFGFYDLKLPLAFQTKLASITRSQHGGAFLGVAIMGALSTLILSPCVTPPLVGALSYIAESGDVILGAIALFTLSLGMGTPLLMLGTSAGKLLPKAGHWMNAVKYFFGVLLLAVAIDLFSRLLPPLFTMLLWATLLIISGNYLGAFERHLEKQLSKFWQGLGLILIIYGSIVIIGATMGNTDPLFPLVKHSSSPVVSKGLFSRQTRHKVHTLKKALAQLEKAQAIGMPAMLDFYATWCTSCVWMERTTFEDAKVKEILSDYYMIKVDVSANDANAAELLKYFKVIAPPTFIFFDSQGDEIKSARLVGEFKAVEFYKHLKKFLNKLNET